MDPLTNLSALSSLTPLVAVCVIFAVLLSVLMSAFLKHLDTKDRRLAGIVSETQNVLQQIQRELSTLAENARQQNEILTRLSGRIPAGRRPASPPPQNPLPERC